MKKNVFYIVLIFFISCSSGENDLTDPVSQDIIPTNLSLTINIFGLDASNPNGDGSGVVQLIASATNAIKYGFKFGSETEQESVSGTISHTFTNPEINSYLVTVFAYSSTGYSISTFETITVFVDDQIQLVWSDEFSVNGTPDTTKWNYDIGNGCPNLCGWGNGEKQYYTNRSDNVIVEDGILKITAKKETYQGFEYTSAKMLTKGKYQFTYGKVEVRAKLPSGAGTWPAIWTLGSNIDTVGWPACGEIDIMEHWGHNPTVVSSATHTPSCSGGCPNASVGEIIVNDYSTEFHVYSLEWTEDELRLYLDDIFLYAYNPPVKNSTTWPFVANQYLILNIAMGGNWFSIDPNFNESTMEIDYVRVYQ